VTEKEKKLDECITSAAAVLVDYDGYNDIKGLKGTIDRALAILRSREPEPIIK
jgi:hypothetical protein